MWQQEYRVAASMLAAVDVGYPNAGQCREVSVMAVMVLLSVAWYA
jgi:hypothetical protein